MRRLNVCVLGPAALIVTALAIALTPMTSNAAVPTDAVPNAVVPNAAEGTTCQVTDAAITWGVKESLRSYISGTIANGEWAVSDGAIYETPNFSWSEGAGELVDGSGALAFDGSIRFMGHDGILDTTLSGLELRFNGSTTAQLVFDVSGTTQDGTPVDENAVDFATIDTSGIAVAAGKATLTAAPVSLTEAGSDAFGTYPAGEEFDPITVTFSATNDCLPAPTAAVTTLERNTVVVIAVGAVTAAAGLIFFVTRWRGTKRIPRKPAR
ncbi:HtaA domain-containing protein [Salinibacterium sp. PAMC 21357]|uniref:HtaA domain-containing protein n=1 Tax=Salinibacterium sp. PAMC 21357 TaxID=1112215 RepID=UPI000288C0F6|nr:HtaA domain-containing protein [Salinibacterium sp. PAMC 21357]